MFRNIHTMHNRKVRCTEHWDSVEDFITRHSVKDDTSTGSVRGLLKDIPSVMLESRTDSDNLIPNNSKPNCQYAKENASKIVKYITKLDQLAYQHTQQLRREKQNRDLKRFIHFLRHKHLSDTISSASFQNELWPSSELIDTCDYKLLRDLYRDLNGVVTERRQGQPRGSMSEVMSLYKVSCEKMNADTKDIKKPLFESKLICYPTSSSYKRITKLQREMGHTNLCSYLSSGAAVNVHQETVLNYPNSRTKEVIRIPSPLKPCQQLTQKSKTKFHNTKLPANVRQGRTNDLNKTKLKEYNNKMLEKENPNCLLDIESKIDKLVNSINLLIAEIQVKQTNIIEKKASMPKVYITSSTNEIDALKNEVMGKQKELIVSNRFVNITKPISLQRAEEIVKLGENRLTNITSKITNDKETNTSNKATCAEQSSVGFTVRMPTADKSVEANEPIARPETDAHASNTGEKSTTAPKVNIANTTKGENTEPPSIMSLLRVSTATVRQLLSLMSTIDYYSYLPLFQSPSSSDGGEPHYVCNICGADFGKASLLNDHIKGHDLGFARNCCACQRVLNSQSVRREELFGCQFCGQRFTRAYCRELHQQGCAKRLGVPTEVASGLILLR